MQIDEAKKDMIVQAKKAMREHLLSLTWEEKVASIARMNAAGKIARESMRKAMARKTPVQQAAAAKTT